MASLEEKSLVKVLRQQAIDCLEEAEKQKQAIDGLKDKQPPPADELQQHAFDLDLNLILCESILVRLNEQIKKEQHKLNNHHQPNQQHGIHDIQKSIEKVRAQVQELQDKKNALQDFYHHLKKTHGIVVLTQSLIQKLRNDTNTSLAKAEEIKNAIDKLIKIPLISGDDLLLSPQINALNEHVHAADRTASALAALLDKEKTQPRSLFWNPDELTSVLEDYSQRIQKLFSNIKDIYAKKNINAPPSAPSVAPPPSALKK